MKKNIKIIISVILVFVTLTMSAFAVTPNYTVSNSYKNGTYYKKLADVKLTGDQATDIVNVALSQIGYHEGSGSSDLSGGSSGSGNYTEYGKWFGNQTSWCAMFVSWCANMAGIPTTIVKKNAIAGGTSCNFGEKKYSFSSREAQPGDIIYVQNDSDSAADHVGIVCKVDDTYIYTAEGNYSNSVSYVKYYKSSGEQIYSGKTRILFYGVPSYEEGKCLKGDVNLDEKVNSIDALNILEYSVGKRVFSALQKRAGDVTNDGKVDSKDALTVLKMSTGK